MNKPESDVPITLDEPSKAKNSNIDNQELLSLITNNVDSTIFLMKVENGNQYRFHFVNDHFFKYTGYKREDFIGKLLRDTVPAEFYDSMAGHYREAIETGEIVQYEEKSPYLDGFRDGLVSLQPICMNNGACTFILGNITNITDRVIIENKIKEHQVKLEEAIQTKDKFLSIISHDLRSPFNAILGLSNLLNEHYDRMDEAKRKKIILNLTNSTKVTFNLVENLLTWSQANRGVISFFPEEFYFTEMLSETLKQLSDHTQKKNIKIDLLNHNAAIIYADKMMFDTVMRNLIGNAIKFTAPHGRIEIDFSELNDESIISVNDTGVGLNAEQQEHLFELTNTISTVGTEGERGSGLGLVICKEFIHKHGGKIWFESEQNKGTTFYFSMPKKK